MGQRGPAPAPTALKTLRGNPGRRPLNAAEPKPAVRAPSCPRHLSREARAEWRRVAPLLMQLRVLTEADRTALSAYCEAYALWVKAKGELEDADLVVETETGYMQQHPLVSIVNRTQAEMRRWLQEFGMTPSSRSRVRVEMPKPKSEFEQYLERKQAGGVR